MSTPEPYDRADLNLMWRVFGVWMGQSSQGPSSSALRNWLGHFDTIDSKALQLQLPKSSLPIKLSAQGWLVGEPLPKRKPDVVPVVTISLGALKHDRVTDAAFRVALLTARDEGTIQAEGWRFEQAELPAEPTKAEPNPPPPAHPYCHAQAIIGWVKGFDCLIHPPHIVGDTCDGIDYGAEDLVRAERLRAAASTLVSHPAFPLPATTLTGLSLTLIAALYGRKVAAGIVIDDTVLARVGGDIKRDINSLHVFD